MLRIELANCIFCRIAAGEIPSTIVQEDDQVVAIEDLNPQAPVHVLVIPKRHFDTIRDLDDPELLFRLFAVANQVADSKGVSGSGYRLVINTGADAGQTVHHLHVHVLGGRPMTWPPG
jgi:histidine triad (HIT) family protein